MIGGGVMVAVGALALPLVMPIAQAPTVPSQRIVGLGFEDVVDAPESLRTVARQLDRVRATGVSISIGRTDWAAYPTALGPSAQSSAVRRTGRDYVAEAIGTVGTSASGKRRSIVLVLDTLVEGWILVEPQIAGVDAQGRASADFASLAQLESGVVGDRLVAMAGEAAARYRPAALSLTELFNASSTFGPDDKASFQAHSGLDDWPRQGTAIREDDPRIHRWRAEVIAGLVARVRAAVRQHGTKLWMEVRVNWSKPGADRLESGHDYALLARAADRLVLWGYFGQGRHSPNSLATIARRTERRVPGRVVMSVGLWGDDGGRVSPRQLARASAASVRGGAAAVWITPNSLMTPAHWSALAKAWRRAG